MNHETSIDTETAELFGGEATAIQPNHAELEVQLALRTIRDHLSTAAEHDKVGVNQLARRLGISPSSVSRLLARDGDIRVSTAVLYARALGRRWEFALTPDHNCAGCGNRSPRPEISWGIPNASTLTTGLLVVAAIGSGTYGSSALHMQVRADA